MRLCLFCVFVLWYVCGCQVLCLCSCLCLCFRCFCFCLCFCLCLYLCACAFAFACACACACALVLVLLLLLLLVLVPVLVFMRSRTGDCWFQCLLCSLVARMCPWSSTSVLARSTGFDVQHCRVCRASVDGLHSLVVSWNRESNYPYQRHGWSQLTHEKG